MNDDTRADVLRAIDDAFGALALQPLSEDELSRVVGASGDLYCTDAATCNFKCGETEYWECAHTVGTPSDCSLCGGTWVSCGPCTNTCGPYGC